MEEVDESETNWLDSLGEELVRELLDDNIPVFVSPEITEPEPDTRSESPINKLISTVHSSPTIGDIESAQSVTFQSGESDGHGGSRPIISLPEKGLGKMESKYTLRIKTSRNGLADDGYKWRKYGQKSIKNSPNPRFFLVSHKNLILKMFRGLGLSSHCFTAFLHTVLLVLLFSPQLPCNSPPINFPIQRCQSIAFLSVYKIMAICFFFIFRHWVNRERERERENRKKCRNNNLK